LRKSEAAAEGFVCAKAQRQQQQRVLFVRKRSDSNSTDVGHEGVITGCDGLSLRSSIAYPQGVALSIWHTFSPQHMVMSLLFIVLNALYYLLISP